MQTGWGILWRWRICTALRGSPGIQTFHPLQLLTSGRGLLSEIIPKSIAQSTQCFFRPGLLMKITQDHSGRVRSRISWAVTTVLALNLRNEMGGVNGTVPTTMELAWTARLPQAR